MIAKARINPIVYPLLLEGEEQAQTGKYLAKLLDITLRQFTAQVEQERRAGLPICATANNTAPGYYKPLNKGELQRYCRRLKGRITELNRTHAIIYRQLKKMPD